MGRVSLTRLAALVVALPNAAYPTPEAQSRSTGQVKVACAMNLDFACVLLEHHRIESGQRAEAEKRLVKRCAGGSVNSCRYLDFLVPDRTTPSCTSWLDLPKDERSRTLIALSRDSPEYGDRGAPRGNLLVPETGLDALTLAMIEFCRKHKHLQLHEALWLKTVLHGHSSADDVASYWEHVRRGDTATAVRHYLNLEFERLDPVRERKRYGCSPPEGTFGRASFTSKPAGALLHVGLRTLGATPLPHVVLPG